MKNSLFLLLLIFFGCADTENKNKPDTSLLYLVVLGTAQDAGYPQAGCVRECCQNYYSFKTKKLNTTSLGLVDVINRKLWLFEATPDFKEQWHTLQVEAHMKNKMYPDGIFLTHAQIGHYTGLMQLGREVMGAKSIPVYAMPRMAEYLTTNGPWSQLVSLNNISINPLHNDSTITISSNIKVTPLLVPHRDEYSETVGFKIESSDKKLLFIPDIDKWEKWNLSIVDEIKKVDIAFIDGTFYKDGELSGTSMKDVPHPFITESMSLFESMSASEKKKIHFIHFNHTNPVIWDNAAQQKIISSGFNYATEGMKVDL